MGNLQAHKIGREIVSSADFYYNGYKGEFRTEILERYDLRAIRFTIENWTEAFCMQKWCTEDWLFELTVIKGKAGHCRLGLEKGDKFVFSYECPAGMCPKTMMTVYTWCEVIRCGGNFTYRGEKEQYEINIPCADGCIQFHLKATPINRDENGKPLPNGPRPQD